MFENLYYFFLQQRFTWYLEKQALFQIFHNDIQPVFAIVIMSCVIFYILKNNINKHTHEFIKKIVSLWKPSKLVVQYVSLRDTLDNVPNEAIPNIKQSIQICTKINVTKLTLENLNIYNNRGEHLHPQKHYLQCLLQHMLINITFIIFNFT